MFSLKQLLFQPLNEFLLCCIAFAENKWQQIDTDRRSVETVGARDTTSQWRVWGEGGLNQAPCGMCLSIFAIFLAMLEFFMPVATTVVTGSILSLLDTQISVFLFTNISAYICIFYCHI